jgi:EGF-like domain
MKSSFIFIILSIAIFTVSCGDGGGDSNTLCSDQNCSGNGTCVLDADEQPSCECDTGYVTVDLTCVDPCSNQDCSGNGECVIGLNGDAQCQCNNGYIPVGLTCTDAPCSNQDCSGNGTCVVDANGYPICQCDNGFLPVDLTCLEHFSEDGGIVSDNVSGLMFMNPAMDHLERDPAITACENATKGGYDDWYLANNAVLGKFHKEMNENGIVPGQLFSYCLAEVTSDGYVKTKKGAEDYGGTPGDPFSFTGAANVRCVRNQ